MKYSEILAKSEPKKTLIEHTNDCLYWFSKVLNWYEVLISKMSEHYSLSKSNIIRRLFITVAFHDIGKATERFQDKVRGLPLNMLESHALTSVPFIYKEIKDNPIKVIDGNPFFPEILAIASHHSKLKNGLFHDYERMRITFADKDYFQTFYDNINQQAIKLNVPDWQILKLNDKLFEENPYYVFYDEAFDYIGSFRFEKTNVIRDLFLLFKSVLHYCDWLASSNNTTYHYSATENNESITAKMKIKVPQFVSWESFQLHAATQNHLQKTFLFRSPQDREKRKLPFYGQHKIMSIRKSYFYYLQW